MALFDANLRETADRFDVELSGEIDLSTIAEVEQRLAPVLEGGLALVVIDLRAVGFLDSSGLRLLLRLDEHQRANGHRCVLIQGPRRVARVFELTGVEQKVEIVGDPADVSA